MIDVGHVFHLATERKLSLRYLNRRRMEETIGPIVNRSCRTTNYRPRFKQFRNDESDSQCFSFVYVEANRCKTARKDSRDGARVEYHGIVNSSYRMVDASTLIFHTVEPS